MKMDKLTREIALLATHHRRGATGGHVGDTDLDFAKEIIPRIGEIVLSGECADLDKLLGVVGRLEQEPQTRPYAHGVEESLKGWILNRFKEGARTFIAVRKEGVKED